MNIVLSTTIGAASWPLFTPVEKVKATELLDVVAVDLGQLGKARGGVVFRRHRPLAVVRRRGGGGRRGLPVRLRERSLTRAGPHATGARQQRAARSSAQSVKIGCDVACVMFRSAPCSASTSPGRTDCGELIHSEHVGGRVRQRSSQDRLAADMVERGADPSAGTRERPGRCGRRRTPPGRSRRRRGADVAPRCVHLRLPSAGGARSSRANASAAGISRRMAAAPAA